MGSRERFEDADGNRSSQFLGMVIVYYSSNSFVILTNKQLVSHMGFNFPITLTCMHMTTIVLFSSLIIDVLQAFEKQAVASEKQRRSIRWLAIQFAVSLICGNWSLRFIDVSYMEMVGATTPIFVCILGFVFFGTLYSNRVYASCVVIVGGGFLSTYGKASGGKGFTVIGLVLLLAATFFRGLKTVWQGHLLQGEEKLSSPNLLRYMATDAAVILLALALAVEGRGLLAWLRSDESSGYSFWQLAALLVVNPMSAYCANYSQFVLIQHSSALTFQVIGNTKGVLNVICSMLIFGDFVNPTAAAGYATTLLGVAWYIREKRRSQ